ncbi:MAG: spore cortex biosynthesis protein YabQ [Clostridia bacterium]
MEYNSLNQAYLFSIFVINGIIIGILFDIFRVLRRSFKTSDIITYIEDFIFWLLTGGLLLYSIFSFNNRRNKRIYFHWYCFRICRLSITL